MNFSMLVQIHQLSILDLAKTIIKFSGLNIEPIFGPSLKGDVHEEQLQILV